VFQNEFGQGGMKYLTHFTENMKIGLLEK